jgi:uncharacterized protein
MRPLAGWLPWAVYAVLGALGAGVSWLYRGTVFAAPAGRRFASDPLAAQAIGHLLALIAVVLTVRSTRLLVERTRWAKALHVHLRGLLLGASATRLLALACASSVAEELFFRAALLPWLGLAGSSLLFGLLHVSTRETAVGWMVWAALMGAVFGALYLGSGSLLAPILAHAAINYENMQYICNYDPTLVDTRRAAPHSAPSRRL